MRLVLTGCLVVASLALAADEIRAADAGRVYGWPQNQAAPNQNVATPNPADVPAPAVVPQIPPAAQQSPLKATQKPSGAVNKPPVVQNKPLGATGAVSAQTHSGPGENFVGGQRDFRHFPHDGNFHDQNFRHGTFCGRHSSLVVVYVNGAPFWYPAYTAYPYYYYTAPVSSTYGGGYSMDSGYAPLVEQSGGQAAPSYGELGRQWGQDLRREVGTWEQFIDYLRVYIINAAPGAQVDFREGFIASYGLNGAAAYDKAADQAAQPAPAPVSPPSQGPKVINMSSEH